MRLAVYGGISTALTAFVLYSTFSQRSNFYTSAIQLSQSSPSLLILLNFGIFTTLMLGKLLQAIFFGPLRAIEVEHLYERSWFAVTETCLAMTIFRDEFDSQFVVLFISLLFVKIFHWLCQDRVDFMEQSATLPFHFHIRMTVLMINLLITDLLFVLYTVDNTLTIGPTMLIVFGFEYAILAAAVLATYSKYVLHVIDSRTEETWENKSLYIFYLELIIDFIKLLIYIIFFGIVLIQFGIPLHILRDIYVTLRSFLQKCRDLIRYRQATRNMNERYPDATPEELSRMSDPTCIICREEMVHRDNTNVQREGRNEGSSDIPKKLPCGHVFHFSCLRSWLERQQSCPTCRSPVLNDSNRNNPPQPPTPPPPPTPPAPEDYIDPSSSPNQNNFRDLGQSIYPYQ
ncbi:hypothetical protein K502DRAFT_337572 [Neoconidiobolus thromboides FSU 785]|nr:hypothetical protein K502DRAFT_337572 [Neoconidiobolus thromboides FSU 785]